MTEEKYSDGLFMMNGDYVLFNLDSKYSLIECTIEHNNYNEKGKTVSFIIDGKLVK